MSVINTNITSMIGQSNLSKSQSALQTSMERLSSGLRINSAKDDAAGQAIANRMSAQITGLAQAQRNANDGISVAQTAEGALNQVNDNVQRIRELSVQAQNGTNSSNDLQSIQDEINQRLDEIDRISEETNFNGVKVLSESAETINIQVGANDGETIAVNLKTINRETLGLDNFSVSGLATSKSVIESAQNGASFTVSTGGTSTDNNVATTAQIVDATSANDTVTVDSATYIKQADSSWVNQDDATDTLTDAAVGSAIDAAADWSANIGGTSYTADNAYVDGEDALTTEATRTEGGSETVYTRTADGWTSNADSAGATDITAAAVTEALETAGTFTSDSTTYAVDRQGVITTGTGDDVQSVYVSQADGSLTTTATDARTSNPLEALDSALNTIDSLRSELGAVQNRFETAIDNLGTNETNLSAARSRIEDADYAVEVANMTRAQILQQAGTSVLAQANQIPQSVLSLLG